MRLLHPQSLFVLATSQELQFEKSTVSRKQAIDKIYRASREVIAKHGNFKSFNCRFLKRRR